MSTRANPLMDQLPTGVDPQRAAMLQSLFPQQPPSAPAGGAAPAAAPPQPTDIMGEMTQASQAGRQAFGSEREKSLGLGSRIEDLSKQQETASGGLAFHPNFKGGFLHNLGQALLTIGAATTPGQAVQNVIYSKPREEYSGRAAEIATLRGQQEESEKRGTAAASMVSKPITAAAQAERGAAAMDRAKSYAPLAAAQAKAAIAGIDLKRAAIDEKARNDMVRELQAKVDEQGRNFRATNKNATDEEVAQVLAGSREAIANEVSARNPSLWNQINAFGVETPQLPGAPQPQLAPTPQKPAKPAASAAPQRPAGVPSDYLYKKNGPQGEGWYRPGSK